MAEKRGDHRNRVYLGGRITFQHGTADCVVRNLSQSGAKISLADSRDIPGQFELTVSKTRRTERAEVSWRSPTEIGVRFLPRSRANVVPFRREACGPRVRVPA